MTRENRNRNHIVLKIIMLIILVAFICLAVLFAFRGEALENFNWEQLDPSGLFSEFFERDSNGKDRTIKLDTLNIKASGVYMENLLVLSDSDIRLLNAKGEELWFFTYDIIRPVLQINGQWILIYDEFGKSFIVINNGKIIIEDKMDENITFGDITDNYIIFICWNDTGYKRIVNLISPKDGVNLGKLFIDDYYPYYSARPQKNEEKYFILPGLGMNSSRISTIIRKYSSDLKSGPVASIQLDGLYPVLLDNGKQNIFVSEYSAYCYNNNMDALWQKSFNESVSAAGMFENGNSIFAFHAKEDFLYFFDAKGMEIKRISLNERVESIVTFNNTAAVIMGAEASFFDDSGKLTDNVSISGLSMKLHFIDEKKVFLLSEHEAVLHVISPGH